VNKYEYAQLFGALGIAVIPLRHRGKEPASHMMGGSWERYKELLPTEYDVKNWLWSGWQNYGVVAGHNHLAVLDFDDMSAFNIWSSYFETNVKRYKTVELIADPFMVKSARGVHVYITLPTDGYNNQKRQGVDVKVHGYVVGPGCTHPSGAMYEPINHTFYFPTVFDLSTILPDELFPMVAAQEIEPTVPEMSFEPQQLPTEYQSDPFEAASGYATGLDLITKVKQSIQIQSWFPDRHQTSGDGRWWACKCIFHDDQSPSAWIDTRKQLYGCQSQSCIASQRPFDAINLYSRMKHISDADAVVELGRLVGVVR